MYGENSKIKIFKVNNYIYNVDVDMVDDDTNYLRGLVRMEQLGGRAATNYFWDIDQISLSDTEYRV